MEDYKEKVDDYKDQIMSKAASVDQQGIFFTYGRPLIDALDNGDALKKPLIILYYVMAAGLILYPLYLAYEAIFEMSFFKWPFIDVIGVTVVFAAFAFSSWMSFQIVWDRKNKNVESIKEGQRYLSTKIVTDLVKVIGECLAIIITITGTVGVIVGLLSDAAGEIVGSDGIFYLFMFPVIGYCILVGSKFMSETVIALTDIAQNTKK